MDNCSSVWRIPKYIYFVDATVFLRQWNAITSIDWLKGGVEVVAWLDINQIPICTLISDTLVGNSMWLPVFWPLDPANVEFCQKWIIQDNLFWRIFKSVDKCLDQWFIYFYCFSWDTIVICEIAVISELLENRLGS